jgi:DNA-binding response OmpR family regulator
MISHVALVEDDADIAGLVKRHLERGGDFAVTVHGTARAFLAASEYSVPDVIILDLNLPDGDGLTLCRELRAWDATRAVPILMLTARASESDRVIGLELGADDYVTKPFSLRELAARVRALVRRVQWERGVPGGSYQDSRLIVDPARRRVVCDGREISLTKRELELLWHLISIGGRVAAREQILDAVWGLAADVDPRTVDAHVRTLRRKLAHDVIETVFGSGYRFREAP